MATPSDSESELSVIQSTSGKPLVPRSVAYERGWCSWCGDFTGHDVMHERLITRDLLKCEGCKHLTGKCMKCSDGFVRAYPDDTMDKLCFKCYYVLPSWGTPISTLDVKNRHCSWCMKQSTHALYRYNFMSRNDYTCSDCQHLTVHCVKCDEAMAKYVGVIGDALCAKCDGSIESWNKPPEENQAKLARVEWCSWCVERCSHTRVQTNVVARHVYHCDNCQQRTLICVACQKAMAQGGPGWDDSLCLSCRNPSINWEILQQRKLAIFAKECTKEQIIANLYNDSVWRRRAVEQGLLRPFLLLVSMSPAIRLQTSCLLGWAYITEDYFGNPHEEAGHILFDPIQGLQTRLYSPMERLNPLADSASWRDVIARVYEAAFKTSLPNADKKSVIVLEEDFLAALQELRRRDMSKAEKEAEERELLADPRSAQIIEALHNNAGVTRPEVTTYAIKVAKKVAGISPLNMTIMSLELAATLVPEAAAELGAVAGALGSLVTPMAIIGMIGLISGGLKLTLGSSEGRIFCPLVLLLHQRLMLGIDGINLEDFYAPRHLASKAPLIADIREAIDEILHNADANKNGAEKKEKPLITPAPAERILPSARSTITKDSSVPPAAGTVPPAEVKPAH